MTAAPVRRRSQTTQRQLILITTGGTIEKTYEERSGALVNRFSLVRRMLDELRLENTEIEVVELMHKDSLDMTSEDRRQILEATRGALSQLSSATVGQGGVVILHGTDTLTETGDLLAAEIGDSGLPIVLTGAIRPFEMKRSDALQNLTEAVFATAALAPGVWVVAHGRALRFPGVRKDRRSQTFVSVAS